MHSQGTWNEKITCAECHGAGRKSERIGTHPVSLYGLYIKKVCKRCSGTGKVEVIMQEIPEMKTCPACKGDGMDSTGTMECLRCGGDCQVKTGRYTSKVIKVLPNESMIPEKEIKKAVEKYIEEKQKKEQGGMTPEEYEISELIVQAVEKFSKLDRTHPDEMDDFVDAIHKLQSILGMRVLRRDYPNYWLNKGGK